MKKEARLAIATKLKKEQAEIRSRIAANRYRMQALVTEQTMLKRQLAELQPLIGSVTDGPR